MEEKKGVDKELSNMVDRKVAEKGKILVHTRKKMTVRAPHSQYPKSWRNTQRSG